VRCGRPLVSQSWSANDCAIAGAAAVNEAARSPGKCKLGGSDAHHRHAHAGGDRSRGHIDFSSPSFSAVISNGNQLGRFHRLPGDTPEIDTNLKANEIITAIELPAQGFAANYSYLKIRDRLSYAFALVSVAAALELEGGRIKDARLALGGVAHKPWRNPEAEAAFRALPHPR
jgi:CO dehydrogenase flavoprotein C-terminal domain